MDNKRTSVIIADAEYIDSVAFNLIVNFERMIGRHIPQADMAQWVECIAMDGGVRRTKESGEEHANKELPECSVILVHDKKNDEMNNFNPGKFTTELNGQAFKGDLGEFAFNAVCAEEGMETMSKYDILTDILAAMVDEPQVKNVMVIPDLDSNDNGVMERLLPVLRHIDRECPEKRVTLFAMQPLSGVPCRTEILGYSLMAALGIRADEIKD
ncbi:hypothetical protein HPS57_02875 [Prevotella sp. PINT]|jgi:hypothetical protein|uniref:DUF6621 family protein n=1 Tax=Palleniella intestinalis TaxID=2736291 RepID=UPI001552E5AA|nr:DUF6621 family protein [Palleniella intestinalis]NPD80920.1 hypothetical protein [Palleniella intestinalis]